MQAAELDLARVVHFLDPGHERDPDAVAQLNVLKAKIDNLAQHLVPGGVARRIPAGGKRDHVK